MWGIKKSPQAQITHTEQQAIKRNTIGRRWGHMVGIWIARGGEQHLRKCSLLNGNQMGYVLLNRIPDLQGWAGAGWGCSPLSPFVCRGDIRWGWGFPPHPPCPTPTPASPEAATGAASRPQAPGSGSVLLSPCPISQDISLILQLNLMFLLLQVSGLDTKS